MNKPKNKKDLDNNLGKVSEAIGYIEDEGMKAMILSVVAVYHKRVMVQIEQSQFQKRNRDVVELEEYIITLEERRDRAYACGVGISDAEEALESARRVRAAAVDQLITAIDLDSAELYVDTDEFDNQEL